MKWLLAVALSLLFPISLGAEPAGPARSPGDLEGRLERQDQARASLAALAGSGDSATTSESGILFGDLHVHTTYSFDGYLFSLPLMGGDGSHPPDDACDFARHCAALDFFALTDHAESLLPEHWEASKQSVRECNERAGGADTPDLVAFMGFEWSQAGGTPEEHFGHRCVVFPGTGDDELPARPISSADTARNMLGLHSMVSGARWLSPWTWDRHTGFLDYIDALTARPICEEGVDTRELPNDCHEIAPTPRELHEKLDQWGLPALTIPHGTSWGVYTPANTRIDKHLATQNYDPDRMRLIEVASGHGNSEEYRDFTPAEIDAEGNRSCPEPTENFLPCCWQAGEIMRNRCGDLPTEECERRVVLARQRAAQAQVNPSAVFPDAKLEEWLDCGQCRDCFKPAFSYRPKESVQYAMSLSRFDGERSDAPPVRFRYGFVGSSDGHTARPGHGYKQLEPSMMSDTRGPADFPYNLLTSALVGGEMEDPQMPNEVAARKVGVRGNDLRVTSFLYPGSLAAVHAEGRSREAIWRALEQRRVYGTSGPRILLWFDLLNGPSGRAGMGSEVASREVPRFEVRAVGSFEPRPGCSQESRDALSPERLEYLCRGECYAPSDVRRPIAAIEVVRIRPQARPGEDVGPLIEDPWRRFDCPLDPAGCVFQFEDPEFPASGRDALYYARALEAPSMALNGQPLGTRFDAKGRAISVSPCLQEQVAAGGCPAPTQERAWSSPIFVDQPTAPVSASARP